VLKVDPGFVAGAMMLAGVEHTRGVAAQRSHLDAEAEGYFEAALRSLETLLAHGGGHRVVLQTIGLLYARLGRREEAFTMLQGLVDGTEPATVHETMALLHLEAGRPRRAIEEAEAAVRMATPSDRQRAGVILEQVRQRAGLVAPDSTPP
jgi:tetratricopeptide (TPR) repeat protein